MKATIGHGLPLSYFDVTGGGSAQISTDGPPTVWANSGATIGFSIRDHDYVAYAPTGATWTVNGATITSTLGGKGYFSVAVLPTKASRHRQHPHGPGDLVRPVRPRARHRHQGQLQLRRRQPAR